MGTRVPGEQGGTTPLDQEESVERNMLTRLLALFAVLALSLGAVACGDDDDDEGGAGGPSEEAADASYDLTIGGVISLTGDLGQFGESGAKAVELAVEQVGPKLGLEVELVALDDQATPDVGASNANQIAADEDIMCVAGHLNSGVALAALPTRVIPDIPEPRRAVLDEVAARSLDVVITVRPAVG